MARRILLIALFIALTIIVIGRSNSMIPVQRSISDNVQRITFNLQGSILESKMGIKKQVLPIATEFPGHMAALSSPYIAVQNSYRKNTKLSVYNLETGEEYTVPTNGKYIAGFDIEGANVVWADLRNETNDPMEKDPLGNLKYNQSKLNWEVFLYNLETKEMKQLTGNLAAQRNPRIWRHYVVWEDNRDDTTDDNYGIWNIYLYDIESGKETKVAAGFSDQVHPRISDGKVVWQDDRNNTNKKYRGCENCPEYNWDIYLYDIFTGEEQAIATGPAMECDPDVSGSTVVWAEFKELNNADILMKDLETGKVTRVTDDSFHQWQPQVDNGRVVWTDERRGHSTNDVNTDYANADVLIYDTRTGETTRLTGDWIQSRPLISGPHVAFLYDTQVNPRYQVIRLYFPEIHAREIGCY